MTIATQTAAPPGQPGDHAARAGAMLALLAVLWLFGAFMAYRQILQRNIQSHRQWMIRTAAVTLRVWLAVILIAGIDVAQTL